MQERVERMLQVPELMHELMGGGERGIFSIGKVGEDVPQALNELLPLSAEPRLYVRSRHVLIGRPPVPINKGSKF